MSSWEKEGCGRKHFSGRKCGFGPGAWRGFRFLEPYILLQLMKEPSYGYQLMEALREKIVHGTPDAGAVYRTLRFLEKGGFVTSTWETKGRGPARRYYQITEDGEVLLDDWARSIEKRYQSLKQFLEEFRQFKNKSRESKKGGKE